MTLEFEEYSFVKVPEIVIVTNDGKKIIYGETNGGTAEVPVIVVN